MLMTNPPAIRTRTDKQAFTLIELLVVISIIAILASLGFPAVNGAIDSARKARAGSDVAQIATAVVAYEVEYGRLPTHSGSAGLPLAGANNPSPDIRASRGLKRIHDFSSRTKAGSAS